MERSAAPDDVLQAAGLRAELRDFASMREPDRLAKARLVLEGAAGSGMLAALVGLASRCTGSDCAQLSLLADEQVAAAVQRSVGESTERVAALEDSLCTVTVLSGDVLVSADTTAHPWLRDLPPVTSGQVGAYLGVPLDLGDGTLVGALCVFEPSRRDWTGRDVGITCDIADVVVLELRRAVATLS